MTKTRAEGEPKCRPADVRSSAPSQVRERRPHPGVWRARLPRCGRKAFGGGFWKIPKAAEKLACRASSFIPGMYLGLNVENEVTLECCCFMDEQNSCHPHLLPKGGLEVKTCARYCTEVVHKATQTSRNVFPGNREACAEKNYFNGWQTGR